MKYDAKQKVVGEITANVFFVYRYAASVKDGSQYFVLLIITDGVISDMAQTKESIVNVRTYAVAVNT